MAETTLLMREPLRVGGGVARHGAVEPDCCLERLDHFSPIERRESRRSFLRVPCRSASG